jgi:glycolate oxidase
MFAPDDLATMRLVREAFDPAGLANPGKIFPTPRSCGESARLRPVLPVLERGTAASEGLAPVEAVELF